jgi:hypothetical protein
MNMDDFEQQLRSQPLREPPAAWRRDILGAARAKAGAATRPAADGWLAGWRALWARLPVAWTAIAAVWLVILGVNCLLPGPGVMKAAAGPGEAQSPMAAWRLQRAEMSLLADTLKETPAPRPRTVAPAPRSDRRREEGFGEFERAVAFADLV